MNRRTFEFADFPHNLVDPRDGHVFLIGTHGVLEMTRAKCSVGETGQNDTVHTSFLNRRSHIVTAKQKHPQNFR